MNSGNKVKKWRDVLLLIWTFLKIRFFNFFFFLITFSVFLFISSHSFTHSFIHQPGYYFCIILKQSPALKRNSCFLLSLLYRHIFKLKCNFLNSTFVSPSLFFVVIGVFSFYCPLNSQPDLLEVSFCVFVQKTLSQ